ncbi:stage II sporulation protein M [Metabacillus idriensis]|uniref:stage II sporulation protein M n=1 Tax=Metabacillus idriensis TaxID=324768 RepID=UPI00174D97C7|nr:stage II sporulation protein M [Metabacillus idriensis]
MNLKKNFKITIILYIVGLIFGIFIGELINLNLNKIEYSSDPNNLATTWYIITRNLTVFIILLSGVVLFKIPTIINLIFNGSVLGFMLSGLPTKDLFLYIAAILIHGIPELIGLFIAAAISFSGYKGFIDNKKKGLTLLLLGVTLIIIAGFIETYISPIILTKEVY